MNWFWFWLLGTAAYLGIALMAQLAAGPAMSPYVAMVNAYRPLPLMTMLVANGLWVVAAFYGASVTKAPVSSLIAYGVIVAYCYALWLHGGYPDTRGLCGVALILAGIYVMK